MDKIKVCCTKCYTKTNGLRIFETDKSRDKIVCPRCGQQLDLIDARHEYLKYINKLVEKVNKFLDRKKDHLLAYTRFGEIVDIDNDFDLALQGRIIALFKMSGLRENTFNQVIQMIDLDKERVFSKKENLRNYCLFIDKICMYLDEYVSGCYKNLTYRDRFYSLDCIKLFFNRCKQILNFKDYLLNELKGLNQLNSYVLSSVENIRSSVSKTNLLMNVNYSLIDGKTYIFKGFSNTDEVKLEVDKINKRNRIFVKTVLLLEGEEDDTKVLIKEKIF